MPCSTSRLVPGSIGRDGSGSDAGDQAREEVHLVRLDPTLGSEIQKTRPCLVVSPDEPNQHLRAAIVPPMTTAGATSPWVFKTAFGLARDRYRALRSGWEAY